MINAGKQRSALTELALGRTANALSWIVRAVDLTNVDVPVRCRLTAGRERQVHQELPGCRANDKNTITRVPIM